MNHFLLLGIVSDPCRFVKQIDRDLHNESGFDAIPHKLSTFQIRGESV
jgi:hypothetical protein